MVLLRIKLGSKTLRVRRGNYGARRFERGPFGCWLASWKWLQIGWELSRWS